MHDDSSAFTLLIPKSLVALQIDASGGFDFGGFTLFKTKVDLRLIDDSSALTSYTARSIPA